MTTFSKTEILLLKYAAGTLNAQQSVTVVILLICSPDMRRKVAEFEALGGKILHEEPPTPLSATCLETVLQRIDARPGRFNRFLGVFWRF